MTEPLTSLHQMGSSALIGVAGRGWGLAVFPLAAAAVAAVFGWVLARRYGSRRRPSDGMWALAMFMYSVASFAAFLGVGSGWTGPAYRLYWLFGATLNVLYLAQGELYLLVRDSRVTGAALAVVLLLTAGAIGITWTADLHAPVLHRALPLGKDAWGDGSAAYQLRWLSWIGYIALLAGLVWSVRRMQSNPALHDRAAGVVAIGFGATIVAVGSGVGAGLEIVPVFALGLAAGIAVMFWGFLRAGRPSIEPGHPRPRATTERGAST